MFEPVHVIGGGLAGSEAAWQLAQAGIPVILHEMRPIRTTAAHKTGTLAELVCSNSFRSDDSMHNAVGLLHEEMRRCGSLIMRAGDAHKLPAGGALAVDRDGFAAHVQDTLQAEVLVEIRREAVSASARCVLRPRDRRDRPADLARARAVDPARHRRGRARVLRCDRTDRASRQHRLRGGLVAVPLRQARARPAPAPTTSTARSTRLNTGHSSRRCAPAPSTSSRSGRPRPPTSRAVCRSR